MKKINLDNFLIQELLQLQNDVNAAINNYKDGYLYICCIRQHGNVYDDYCFSRESAQLLCDEYRGDNGIVDVYTTNPNLKYSELALDNYGDTYYITSEFDYKEWKKWQKSMNYVLSAENDWKIYNEWKEKENTGFYGWSRYDSKPSKPYSAEEEIAETRHKLEKEAKSIIIPVLLSPTNNVDI